MEDIKGTVNRLNVSFLHPGQPLIKPPSFQRFKSALTLRRHFTAYGTFGTWQEGQQVIYDKEGLVIVVSYLAGPPGVEYKIAIYAQEQLLTGFYNQLLWLNDDQWSLSALLVPDTSIVTGFIIFITVLYTKYHFDHFPVRYAAHMYLKAQCCHTWCPLWLSDVYLYFDWIDSHIWETNRNISVIKTQKSQQSCMSDFDFSDIIAVDVWPMETPY